MDLSATATKNALNSHLTATAAAVLEAKTVLSDGAETLWRKLDRKAIQIEQAAEASARVRTSNLEDHIDMQRSLYAHQTQNQNEYDAQIRDVPAHSRAPHVTRPHVGDAAFVVVVRPDLSPARTP